ncbi:putative non-specific serine/threonine protein kinase [Helianthus debilis subsp. tardiflorus]
MDRRIRLWMMICFCQVMVIAAVTDSNDLAVLNTLKSRWQNLPPDWKGSDPCGSNWEGIKCTNSRVTTLDLSYNKGIKAVLPPSIQNLKSLTTLLLVGCSFMGPIPDSIGSLNQLVFLGLNNNRFTGPIPPSIGNLINLSWLDLSDNQLSGPIPVSNPTAPGLDNLVTTKHFHLSNNQLSGSIRSQLFNSSMSLIHFIVNNNQFSGPIPASIGFVQTLEVIRLDSNWLTGDVPQKLTELKSVNELHLSNNNLTGPIPDLSGMKSLSYVDMSSNSFEYSDIPAWFTLPSLTTM